MNYIKNKVINIENGLFLCKGDCVDLEFTVPKEENGIALYNEEYQYYFVAQNINKERTKYEATKKTIKGEEIILTWSINSQLTEKEGTIDFSLLIEHSSNEKKDFIYSSLPSKINIKNTLFNQDLIVPSLEELDPNKKINGSNLINNSVDGNKLSFDFLDKNFKIENGKINIDNLKEVLGNDLMISLPEEDTDEEGNPIPSTEEAVTLFQTLVGIMDTYDILNDRNNIFGNKLGFNLYKASNPLYDENMLCAGYQTIVVSSGSLGGHNGITLKSGKQYMGDITNKTTINFPSIPTNNQQYYYFDSLIYYKTNPKDLFFSYSGNIYLSGDDVDKGNFIATGTLYEVHVKYIYTGTPQIDNSYSVHFKKLRS